MASAQPSPLPSPSSSDDDSDDEHVAVVKMPMTYIQTLQDAMDHYDFTGWCDTASVLNSYARRR